MLPRRNMAGPSDGSRPTRSRTYIYIYIYDSIPSNQNYIAVPPDSQWHPGDRPVLVLGLVRLHKVLENPHSACNGHAEGHDAEQSSRPRTKRLDLWKHAVRLRLPQGDKMKSTQSMHNLPPFAPVTFYLILSIFGLKPRLIWFGFGYVQFLHISAPKNFG